MNTLARPALSPKQRAFLRCVRDRVPENFHRRVVEPIEGPPFGDGHDLVTYIGGLRPAGCNSLHSLDFVLTFDGEQALTVSGRAHD